MLSNNKNNLFGQLTKAAVMSNKSNQHILGSNQELSQAIYHVMKLASRIL